MTRPTTRQAGQVVAALVAAGPPPAAVVDAAMDATVNGTLRAFLRELVPAARLQLLESLRTEHAERFAQAKRWLADDLADQTLEVARDESIPVDRARLIIEALQRRCATLHPDVYGERTFIEHSGTVTLEVSACASTAALPAPATSSRSQTTAATTTRRRSSKCS